jgi:hypothetical protein
VRHPVILDAVEDVLGPDLLVWTTGVFIKEARDPAFVSPGTRTPRTGG